MEKPILVMGGDDHARAVEAYLLGKGQRVVLFRSNESLGVEGTDEDLELVYRGMRYGAGDIKSFYWRNYDGVEYHEESVVVHNRRSLFESWLKLLECEGVPMYNSGTAWAVHRTKPYQQFVMRKEQANLEIVHVEGAFYEGSRQNLQMVRKGAQGGLMAARPGTYLRTDAPLASQVQVVGMTFRLFTSMSGWYALYHIQSPFLDYREDSSPLITRYENAPTSLICDMQRLMACVGFTWTGADLILDGNGIWHLLDMNPSPMFQGFSDQQLVLKELCNDLMLGESVQDVR